MLTLKWVELWTHYVFLMPVDTANPVVIWECNQNPQQQWIFTDDGELMLANNTSLFHSSAFVDYY
jgi:hypothetical protein